MKKILTVLCVLSMFPIVSAAKGVSGLKPVSTGKSLRIGATPTQPAFNRIPPQALVTENCNLTCAKSSARALSATLLAPLIAVALSTTMPDGTVLAQSLALTMNYESQRGLTEVQAASNVNALAFAFQQAEKDNWNLEEKANLIETQNALSSTDPLPQHVRDRMIEAEKYCRSA